MKTIYLDYAAATPVDPRVLAAMQPYFTERFFNPSANYLAAENVRKSLEAARAKVADVLGARPSEIIFTAGGTEANNLAIHGVMKKFPNGDLIVSAVEHESVLAPAGQYKFKLASVTADGRVDIAKLLKQIDEHTVLVSVMYANNEVGTIQPIRQLSQELQVIRRARQKIGNRLPLYLHTDACQAANYLDLHVSRLGVDLMTLNGGKIYGPKQSGALYVSSHVQLEPLILGGGQERGLRSGTENVAAIIGFAEALNHGQSLRRSETERLSNLQKLFFDLLGSQIPKAVINGSLKTCLPNNVHLTLPGQDNERLLFALDEAGIQAAAGSACSTSSEEPSHVLRAMGVSTVDAQSSLRLTMGRHTTAADIRRVVKTLSSLV
jgi:cysteine desulfurase